MKIKNKLFFLFAALLIIGAPIAGFAQINVSAPIELSRESGETAVLPISVTDLTGKNITSFQFDATYDTSKVEITSYDATGTISAGLNTIDLNASADGSVTCAGFGDVALTGEGEFIKLYVLFKNAGTTSITFSNFKLNDTTYLLNGVSVIVGAVDLSFEDVNGDTSDAIVLDISVDDLTDKEVLSYEFTLKYDENVMDVTGIDVNGTLSEGATPDFTDGNGECYGGVYSSAFLNGEGVLFKLNIKLKNQGTSEIYFDPFTINEGTPAAISDTATVSVGLVDVNLPTSEIKMGDTSLVTISIEDVAVSNVTSYQFSFNYNVSELEVIDVVKENSLSQSWQVDKTIDNGICYVGAFNSTPLEEGNELIYLKVLGLKAGNTELTWNNFQFNEGNPVVSLNNGQLSIIEGPVEMTISDAIVDADGDYVPDKLGREVIVTGIVTTPNFNSGADFSIQSGNSAIVVYAYSTPTAATIGDSVLVYGEIEQYRGKTEIGISDSTDVVVLSSGNALPEPILLTSISGLDLEAYESRLVKFENVKVANADEWPETDNDANLDLVIAGDTLTLRIDRDTDIDGWEDHPDQYTYFDLTCVIDQFTYDTPANNGYQAKPGAISDFENLNTPPDVAGVVAASTTELQVRFTEDVNAVSADNFSVAGNAPSAVAMPQGNIAILTIAAIDTNTEYSVEVSGVSDLDGIEMPAAVTVPFKLVDLGEQNNKDIVIDTWEDELGTWWQPTGSGSTWGILAESSFEVSDEAAYEGSKSGKLNILNDPASDGWFVRLCNRTDMLEPDSKLYFYMKGADADVQVRFVIWDNGMGGDGYEASEWVDVTIKEDDWQTVCVDLAKDTFTGWITGTGEINSSSAVKIESIQIQTSKNIDATLYFDLLTERAVEPQAIEPKPGVPTTFALDQNYPNPFNPTTSIKYQLPENAQVKLVIYDVMGNVVRTLVNEKQSTGYQSVVWDARNDHGTRVSSGVYIYHMQANNYHQTRKMMLIK
jgi:DNA/RNA endonuclease YhcR with UshA esterase domain